MRVLVHLNSLELGGTQINAVDFAAAARSHGVESILVGDRTTVPDGPSLLDIARQRGLDVEQYIPHESILGRGRQLTEMAERHRAELIHVYGSWGGAARPTYWGYARFGRRPWLQTVYEMEVSPKVKRHMPLIVGTGYLIDELRDRPAPTVLISPPVDTTADRPDQVAAAAFRARYELEGPLVTIISRLDASMKALPVSIAIDAMRELAGDCTLIIVGAGDDEARLRAQGADVNLSVGREAVRFIGPLSDPRPAYAAADVMLGMGGSAARSLAFGAPLIVQGEAGWSQLFESATAEALMRNSYWSAENVPNPVSRLVSILRPVLADADLRELLGSRGREFAEERFSLDAMTRRLVDFYRASVAVRGLGGWVADLPPELAVLSRKVVRGGLRRFLPRVEVNPQAGAPAS